MGIFSSSKKVYVTATAYNLGGEEEDRVDFVKHTVLNAGMQNSSASRALIGGIISGSGVKVKNAFRYAKDDYEYGVPNSNVLGTSTVNHSVLVPILSSFHPGAVASVLTAYISPADYEFWADKHLAEAYGYDRITKVFANPPAGVSETAIVSYDYQAGKITFSFLSGLTVTTLEHTLTDFLSGRMYVHATYRTSQGLPDINVTSTRAPTLGEENSVTTQFLVTTIADQRYEKTIVTTVTIAAGVATVHVLTTEYLFSRSKYFTYLLGLGTHPTLDVLLTNTSVAVPYYPAVPLRADNVDMTDEAHQSTDLYKTSKKFLDRVGLDMEQLSEKLNDNPDIKDIDFAFVVFGVSLRTKTEAGKRYLYQFMEHLDSMSTVSQADFDAWNGLSSSAKKGKAPPTNNLLIYDTQNRAKNYDIKLQWQYVSKTLVTGLIHPGARIGDIDISIGAKSTYALEQATGFTDTSIDTTKMYLRKQVGLNSFEILVVNGLYFSNFIYDGKAVEMSAHEAFTHTDKEVGEGFLIPLNRDILRNMGGRWMTQLGQECMYLVVNCYQIVKKKWYQTGIFQVILAIVAIVLMVAFPPTAGLFTSISTALFGSAVLTVAMSYLVATLTVLASMVIMKFLTPVLIKAFGEEWGRVLAVIASMVAAGQVKLTQFTNFMALSAKDMLMAISRIIQTTTKLYGAYVQGQAVGLQADLAEATTEYKEKLETVEELQKKLMEGNNLFDIEGYLEGPELYVPEGVSTFLARTLMTGSEIVDLTLGLVTEYANISMDLRTTT